MHGLACQLVPTLKEQNLKQPRETLTLKVVDGGEGGGLIDT